jgi:hypothetical protein
MRKAAVLSLAGSAWGVASSLACVPPPQMCLDEPECGVRASCVAGRCVTHGAIPAIASSRRLLYAPVDLAYVRPGARGREASAGVAWLGRGDGALLLLRFDVPLPLEVDVVEAYLVLERAVAVDVDPTLISLHAARVVDPWDGATVSWALQPRVQEVNAPVTRVRAATGPVVRLDVHDLVQRWRRHGADDQGLAVVAAGRSRTGIALAMAPMGGSEPGFGRGDPVLSRIASRPAYGVTSPEVGHDDDPAAWMPALPGPELELYVK